MVNVNDMYYAWTTNQDIKAKAECGGAVTTLLKYALESGMVDAVLAVTRGADIYDGVPTLITDPADVIKSAGSLHCAPLNLVTFLAKYLDGAKNMKIAMPVKGCEARSMMVLAKRGVVNLDNIIMIGLNCGGTVRPMEARDMIYQYYGVSPDDVIKEEIDKGKFIIVTKDHEHKGISIDELEEKGAGRRSNCQRCEVKIPKMADLACGNWGVIGDLAGKATFVEVCSDKGAKLLSGAMNAGLLETAAPIPKGLEIREKTNGAMLKLGLKHQRLQFQASAKDPYYYANEFSKCIKCMGCTVHCPLKTENEGKSPAYELKGSIPPSFTYHLAKVAGEGADCVNCGGCEDVCPMDIPVTKLYHDVAKRLEV
ncbi:formate dehydrogenase [Methanocella sp. CWC-04]|uniref:Formate dehydrogenase n=1 Tax=Methanooceanicella nereidis TaxID=2052831 RepID=A0AAP2W504_9EURY|nr:Coenzyme F420 hydrogenase/dehydrogenase, beta subunit C-terminal domain [Methanocella sp. CWC-04]MCD1293788.1 formate dehydrogenase [Methanocella sp. CWC-04]